jgi:hypothetical protein
MSDLKKIFVGQKFKKFPAHTWNKLLAGELRDRGRRSPPDIKTGSPHSPVVVRLHWDGGSGIGAGRVVKLSTPFAVPGTDEIGVSAGLGFGCSAFAANEPLKRYAITLGPIDGGGEGVGYGVIPEAWWALVNVLDTDHEYAQVPAVGGDLLESVAHGELPIVWKPNQTGERWCIVQLLTGSYQLIRGTAVTAVTPVNAAFQIQAVTEFEEHAVAPTAPVWVAAPPGGTTLSEGDYVWAAYHRAFTTHDPGGGPVDVDWVMIPTAESQSTPPLRRFAITSGKFSTTPSVTANWLDFADNPVGDPVVIDDPHLLFAGQDANYISGEAGFRGVALQRSDLAEEDPEPARWEMVAMEGFARWITATYESAISGDSDERKTQDWFRFTGVYATRDQWNRKPPQLVGSPIRWYDDIEDPLVEPIVGDTVLMMLVDADGFPNPVPSEWEDQPWSPLYVPVAVFDRTAVVQVRSDNANDPAGMPVQKAPDVFPGKRANTVGIVPVDNNATSACWITDLSGAARLPNKAFYLARLNGVFNPDVGGGGEERPVYVIEKPGVRFVQGQTTAVVSAAAATFSLTNLTSGYGTAPPAPLQVTQAFPVGYESGQYVLAIEAASGQWVNTPDSGKSRVDALDVVPEFLHNKFFYHGVLPFDEQLYQPVYAGVGYVNVGGNNVAHVSLFTAKAEQGEPGPPGTYNEGYAIDIESGTPPTIHFDPTEITGHAPGAALQIFVHFGGSARTDPLWQTINGYDENKEQLFWHELGTFEAKTLDNYDAGKTQWFVSVMGSWKCFEIENYQAAEYQVFWHKNAGDDKWRCETTEFYAAATDQLLAKHTNDAWEWWNIGSGIEVETGGGVRSLRVNRAQYIIFDGTNAINVDRTLLAADLADGVTITAAGGVLSATGTQFTAGCGVTIVDNEISVNIDDLMGPGLTQGEGCQLAVAIDDCTLMLNAEDELAVDLTTIAGDGLGADFGSPPGSACTLFVKTGCGLMIDTDNVAVKLKTGGYLACDPAEGLSVDQVALAAALADGETITADSGVLSAVGGGGGPTYTAGCGINIASNVISAVVDNCTLVCAGGVLSVDLTTVAGYGLEADYYQGACSLNLDDNGLSLSQNQQFGHDDAGNPIWRSVADWLKTLPGWSTNGTLVLIADDGEIRWEQPNTACT